MSSVSSKRAASHVEIIIAFILFVTFVVFLLYFIKPFKSDTVEDNSLLMVKNNFFELSSVNLTVVLGNFSNNDNKPCKPKIVGTEEDKFRAIAKPTPKENIYEIYISDAPDFNGISGLLSDCSQDITLGDIKNQVVLSNETLANYKIEYRDNYETFKQRLGLPPNADFSVLAPDYILEKRAPDQIKVIAGAYRKPVLDSSGTLINKDFIFKVW